MTSSSPTGMCIQFRTLTFHNCPEEQRQERLRLKKSVTSLPAVIEALGSPLGPHLESDLAIDLYSGSTPIANMDKSDHRFIINSFKESMISLAAAIGALGSPLGPHTESDPVIDLYSGSTPIAIIDESGHQISFNNLNKFAILLSAMIGALGSPLGPHPESNLETDLYFGSTPIAIKISSIAESVLDNFKKATSSLQ
jgi:hypothetical protein